MAKKQSDPTSSNQAAALPNSVRAYPSILAACLKLKHVPAAQLYLLLQAIDPEGRGMFDVDHIKATFTNKKLNTYLWGQRHLRNILNAGEGIFWKRHTAARLWLTSPAHVAMALGVKHLSGSPVAIPTAALLAGKHKAAAAFADAWHAGRGNTDPISRKTLQELLGVAPSTQRTYDKTASITRRRNIAILGDATKENMQAAAWKYRGRLYRKATKESKTAAWKYRSKVFKFCDTDGKLGKPGYVYAAVNMPNSFISNLEQLPAGRKRKNNKAINLVTNEARGKHDQVKRVYYPDGGTAADAYNRNPDQDHYYRRSAALLPTPATPSKLAGASVWSIIEGQQ